MEKVLSLVLILVLALSLCACGQDQPQSTTPDTQGTTAGTEGTTGATQAPTDGPTTPPTQSPTETPTTPPTESPTEAPTEAPTQAPTTCSHSWKDSTCTAPKTCTKCGETEGNAAGHSWSNATCTAPKTCTKCGATEGAAAGHSYTSGTCTVCGVADPNVPFTDNIWVAYIVRAEGYSDAEKGEILSKYALSPTDFQGYTHKDYYSNPNYEGEPFGSITYNGKTYYDYWFSSNMNGITWEDNGATVTVTFAYDYPVIELVLTRTSETKFTVSSSSNEATIPVGTVFEHSPQDD